MNPPNPSDPSVPDETMFLGVGPSDPGDIRAVILPLPLEKTVSFGRGTCGGPQAILRASHQVELFDEETMVDFADPPFVDTADPLDHRLDLNAFLEATACRVREIAARRFPVVLGGEHTLSYGVLRGITGDHRDLTVVQIDAHADLIDALDGRRWSHGTVMRRVAELGCRIIQVGIRSLSREEYEFARGHDRIATFYDHEMPDAWDRLIDTLRSLTGEVYLSIDVDGIDPALIPSTGTPQPGGLSWRRTLDVVRAIAQSDAEWRGADVVEYIPSPAFPGCDLIPARLLTKILAYRFGV